jgi:hypothetical protein
LKNIVNPKNVRYKKELQKKKENTEKIISALVASENPTDFILESISTKTKELSKYEDALKEINTPVLDKINKVKNMFVKIENLIDSYKKIPEIYTEEEILNNTEKFEVFGKRTKNDFSPTEPIFVPHFKNSPDYLIKNKLNELGIDLPKYNFIPVSGLEHAEFYEDCRENLELNKALKEYVSNFDTFEEAQKYSSTDNSISEELSAYILYFNSKEEALSDNKLSFYDKDMVKEDDIVIPKKSTLKSVELDYDMDDLNLMYGDNVETFNEDGEIVEDIGYLFDMGVEGSDNFTQLTNKIETLKKVLKSIEDKYK